MLDPDMDAAHQETQDEAIEAAFNPLVGRYDGPSPARVTRPSARKRRCATA
jgi:hypothetical protein